MKRRYKLYKPTIKEFNIINGILLGDGHICAKGNSAYMSICTSSIGHATYIFNCFDISIWSKSNKEGPLKYSTYDKRTGKFYTGYKLRTKANEFFSDQHKLWYTGTLGEKRIPQDLKINETSCLLLYLGDGGMCQYTYKDTKKTANIKISTNSFLEENIKNTIFPQIIQFDPKIMYNENKPTIYIPRRRVEEFLKYIGDAPFDDYKHKWIVYKYSETVYHKYDYKKVLQLFNKGITIQSISEQLNIPLIRIQVYFRKYNIIYERIKINKHVNKFDLNNNLIDTYDSVISACKKNGFLNSGAPSAMSRCCSGGRPTYKGFIWEFV